MTCDEIRKFPLKRLRVNGGDVLHGMKASDIGYKGFGEVYFSWVEANAIKGWKRHKRMTLNLVVPTGDVRFIFFDNADNSHFKELIIGDQDYSRLCVPPGIWFGFQGISNGKGSLIMNLADIIHDPIEVERIPLDAVSFDWRRE
ncbi:WxcM-like domain-containing protein [Polynucleobacter sp. Adler-ghost]|uniref:WxcM-like domain-containing protein n=1 Tax=Polynucleobacter sp. Adler-ghost TaxID=2770234 RepID=UPI001BFD02B9|nr:WxcM-like domain-containing protein [Polynucleobacter sp. Adler-ghost]QWE31060.1 WxcM-like domain-containing protein [Polynucleobacter sp. Adler-ghost]